MLRKIKIYLLNKKLESIKNDLESARNKCKEYSDAIHHCRWSRHNAEFLEHKVSYRGGEIESCRLFNHHRKEFFKAKSCIAEIEKRIAELK